jgi:riboflavin synthase
VFTGIIEEVGKVISVLPDHLKIAAEKVTQGMEYGQSIAVNGLCLTVTDFNTNSFSVDIMPETLKRSNIGALIIGDDVNLERPVSLGGQLGGHLVQGHVDDTGRVTSIIWDGRTMLVRIDTSPEVIRYIVEKGFIAVNGVSLTVTTNDAKSFQVSIVDYTQNHTIMGNLRVGSLCNLEVDIIAKYVERLSQARESGISTGFLQEHGFLVT